MQLAAVYYERSLTNNRYNVKVSQSNQIDKQNTSLDTFKIRFSLKVYVEIHLCKGIAALPPLFWIVIVE